MRRYLKFRGCALADSDKAADKLTEESRADP